MLQVDYNDLDDIRLDIEGFIDTLTILEASNYKEDTGVFRTLRNSIETIQKKLNTIMRDDIEQK